MRGGGILPKELILKYKIINAHPGWLPNVRGLDALKWAIYDGQPIGVTTHLLGDDIDSGWILERKMVPIYYNDTFHAVAQRQYELEVSMLAKALELEPAEYTDGQNYTVHKRMPHAFETRVLERFEIMRKKVDLQYKYE